jgi:hypothetical protein
MWVSRRRWLEALERLRPAWRLRAGLDSGADDPEQAMRALAAEIEAQDAAARWVDEITAAFPEVGARGVVAGPPEEVAVLAIELRRLIAKRPGAVSPLEHHSRDLAIVAAAVAEHGGTVIGTLGHRLLAEFRGADRTLRAVAAAVDLIGPLSGDGGASSIEAPHVAIATGEAWSGSVDYRGRAELAVIGPSLQRIERVMHDAIPGEIVLARNAYEEIASALGRAGETAIRRAGTVGAQEVYALAADAAASLVAAPRSLAIVAAHPLERGRPVTVPPRAEGRAPASETSPPGAPDARFAGRYRLRECLGASADGDAWKATDEDGRWVVVKRVHDGTELDQSAAAEWLRVQRALTRIESPAVIAAMDADGAEGCLYSVRPYLRARTLRSILEQGRPPRRVASYWARQLASGLAALHSAGIVHAGVRAENVLIDAGGTARWIDPGKTLGRARLADGPGAAPEWREGREPDFASDVFGLGALLEELVLGADEPGSRADDEGLRRVVNTCLLEDPALRYPSAVGVRDALTHGVNGGPAVSV